MLYFSLLGDSLFITDDKKHIPPDSNNTHRIDSAFETMHEAVMAYLILTDIAPRLRVEAYFTKQED